jgi:hypothetical protein
VCSGCVCWKRIKAAVDRGVLNPDNLPFCRDSCGCGGSPARCGLFKKALLALLKSEHITLDMFRNLTIDDEKAMSEGISFLFVVSFILCFLLFYVFFVLSH